MNNINKTAYYALHIDNSFSSGNYLEVGPVKWSSKVFSFDIWIYTEGMSHAILSQPNGFIFGIEDNLITFFHPSIGKKSVYNDLIKFNSREWVNFFVTYDGQELAFAINGMPVKTEHCLDKILISDSPVRLGEGFSGYVRTFRLYSASIRPEDYKKYIYQAVYTNEMSDIYAFVDFNTSKIRDLSPHKLKINVVNACGIVDVAHVYRPSSGKYATLNNAAYINPGGFNSGNFSLYVKLYIRPSDKEKQVLFSNGNFDDQEAIILYTQKESLTSVRLYLQLGTEVLNVKNITDIYNWLDVVVSYTAGKIIIFLNGEEESYAVSPTFKRVKQADVKIGNCFDNNLTDTDFTCEHYISMIAVFDRVLVKKDAVDFLENHPFIFEDDLIALYSFDSGVPVEYVSCRPLTVEKADLLLAQRTTEVMPSTSYQYRLNKTPRLTSALSTWQADTLYTTYSGYYGNMYDLVPTIGKTEEQAVFEYMANDTSLLDKNMDLFVSEEVSPEMVTKSITQLDKERVSLFNKMFRPNTVPNIGGGGIIPAVTASATVVTAPAVAAESSMAPVLWGLGIGVAVGVAVAVATKTKSKQDEKPDGDDDDDDEDEGRVTLKLTELSFQHNPGNCKESAVYCRNYEGPVSTPEWTSKNRTSCIAVYIAGQIAVVKIKAGIKIIDNTQKPKDKYSVKLSAYAKNGTAAVFNHLEFQGSLSRGENKEVMLVARELNFPQNDVYKRDMELCWNYEIDGKANTTYNTKVTVYVCPKIPAPPIYLEKEMTTRYIAIEYLDIFSRIIEEAIQKSVVEQPSSLNAILPAALTAFTDFLYLTTVFTYQLQDRYGFYDVEAITVEGIDIGAYIVFKEASYMRLLATGPFPLAINCIGYAVMLAYYFSLQGVISRIVQIAGLTNMGTHLHMPLNAGVTPANYAGVPIPNFGHHVIVEVAPQQAITGLPGVRYFDASLRGPGGVSMSNVPFTNTNALQITLPAEANSYRGIVFQAGNPASIVDSLAFGVAHNL